MKKNPIYVSDYGTIRERILYSKKKSYRDFFTLSTIITSLCVAIDFSKLFLTLDKILLPSSWIWTWLLAIGGAIALDVPMMFAGKKIVECEQKLATEKQKKEAIVLAVSCFLLIFIPLMALSVSTRNSTFETQNNAANDTVEIITSSGNTESTETASDSTNVSENEEDVASKVIAAILAGLLPLATSLVSYFSGRYLSNPLEEKKLKLLNSKEKAHEHLAKVNQGITEEETFIDRQELLLANERDSYKQFIEECYDQENIRIQAFLEALEEKCDDPDSISRITEYAQSVLNDNQFSDTVYEDTSNVLHLTARSYQMLPEFNENQNSNIETNSY